ncbi:class I SAM-dependent DNA methyltransferase [Salinarimonas rosea]|uniref:class I SAM-dependent DNA methyltransferase n=1 Tax=Salinarimonas rosea TaxID=552063 RepID=UPI000693BB38|nr:class I SAM-dependent methyltransferase [Salinarimonas rosea]
MSTQDPYGDVMAEAYDAFVEADAREDLQDWLDLARACAGPVLELGSGTGRLLVPMQAEGLDVEGLDASEAMLARCRRRAEEHGLSARLHHRNMTAFTLDRSFALVFCAAGTVSLLGDGALDAMLASTRRACRPGALVALDVDLPGPAPDLGDEHLVRDVLRPDGVRMTCRLRALEIGADGVHRYRMTTEITAPGHSPRVEVRPISFRPRTPELVASRLALAGFVDITIRTAPGRNAEGRLVVGQAR